MKEIVLPGVYERISITNTIHESPGIRVRAFLFLNDLENAVDFVCWNTWLRKEQTSAVNPKTESIVSASRRKLKVGMTLPLNMEYESMIKEILTNSNDD